ncbi:restriction endonuclease subunit S [Acinetobacter baumannii]|uniref:restriction endonuclease subunit S n=1 Tax=Acinetobacter baumannii TaxID=470 RepID=UPI000D3D6207|nr:restriction endonuclease subunit S [Acinetobacter baumannii]PUV01038.1 restriction endonuclease subunit S [Acinetobacter baumannii]HEE6638201.1 restriction endonuclease subunit S [Acinetobacter baumannii]
MAKYHKYAEYKDSGVDWLGEIPSHWEIIPVGRLFTRLKRTGFPSKELLSVYRDYGVIPKSSRDDNNNKPSDDLGQYQLVQPNDLVMNKMKAWQGSIAISEYEGIVSPAYFVYEPLKKLFAKAFPKYVHYLLRNPRYIAQYLSRSKGIRVNQWDLDPEEFQRIELVLPPKSEQDQIFSFLDHETAKIDTLIAKQEKLIELLKEKRQAVISHAVTKGLNPNVPMKDSGVEWLGEVPEHWEIWKFSHIAPIITCGVASTPTYVDESEGMPFLSAQNIKNNKLSLHKFNYISHELHEQLTRYRRPEYGDILVTRVGAGIGEACVVDIDLEFSIYVSLTHIRVKAELAHNKFIMYFFGTDYCKFLNFDGTVTGGGVGNLNVNNVVRYKIALPSIEEQQQITEYLDNYINKQDELIAKAESAIQLMQERRTALISAAVTGKIDVRNWQHPNQKNNNNTELSA